MNDSTEVKLHFLDYWRVVRTRAGIIGLTFLLTMVTAGVTTYFLPRQYFSKVTIEVKPDDTGVKVFGNTDTRGSRDATFAPTQFQILRSKEILYPVIESLGLVEKWSVGGAKVPKEQAYFKLLRMFDMREVRNTDLIEIGIYSTEPKEAADVANSVAVIYQEKRRSDQLKLLTQGLAQVQEEVAKQRKVVEDASAEAAKIRIEKGIIDDHPEDLSSPDQTETRTVVADETKADDLRVDVAKLQTQLDQISQMSSEQLMVALHQLNLEDPTIMKILPVYQDAVAEEAKLLNSGLGPNHPRIKSLRAANEVYGKQLNEAVTALKSSLETRLKIQQATLTQIEKKLEASQKGYQAARTQGAEYIEAKNRYIQSKKVLEAAELNLSTQTMQSRISIQPAKMWEKAEPALYPSKPNVIAYLALAAFVGLVIGVGLAFFLEYLDTSVKTLEDVEKFLGIPVLAVVPKNVAVLMNERAGEMTPDAEAYRILRTNIEFNRKNPEANTITLISGGPGEGKSTTLCNLAYTCAKGGYNVLIVDADLRRPSQHRLFNVDNSVGLSNYLTSNMPFEEVVRSTKVENLSFIPSGLLPMDAVGILNSQRMSDLIMKVKRQYDLVFFDSPPILGVSDGSILASEVDLAVMVVEHRRFPRSMLQRVKQAVLNVNGNLLGVVLNKVDSRHDSGYQYYTNYNDYYAPQRVEEEKHRAAAKAPVAVARTLRSGEQY